MSNINCIGILTSGGDAPGMNAAIRAITRTAIYNGIKVMGIRKGYNGLIHGDIAQMNARSVSNIINRGGTVLHSARSDEFMTEEGRKKAVSMAKVYEMDGIIVIGGDGSFRGAQELSEMGVPAIGIPGTIDNDIGCTDYTIGFDTAVNTALDAINKLRDTAASHDRCSIIEVMGRDAGYIALHSAIAGGAEHVLIPEKQHKADDVIKSILEAKNNNKTRFIVVVSEGVGGAKELAKDIQEHTGIETRATVLGHIQRGGSPTARDRIVASQMGARAVELLVNDTVDRVIAVKDSEIVDYDMEEALQMKKSIDENMFKLTKTLAV